MQLPTIISTSLGWLAYEFARLQPFIPTYTHLIVSALFPIYAGAHSSLSRPSTAAKPIKSRHRDGSGAEEEDDETIKMEGLSPTDALLFPIFAGTTLAGLYFLIKWLQDPTLLNKILNWYFATFSVFSVARLTSDALDVFHSLLFPHDHLDGGILFHVKPLVKLAVPHNPDFQVSRASPLPWIFSRLPLPSSLVNFFWTLHVLPGRKLTFKIFVEKIGSFKLALGIHGIEGLTLGLVSVLYYNFVSKPWWLTNLMGFGFAYGSLQILSPTTFWTGTLILSGLFFYDIYFVFFTPMMVTVAKSLDIPIKLLFPRPPDPGSNSAVQALSMLGLGDVVLPGIMIGLALRFDLHMFYLRKQTKAVKELGAIASASDATSTVQAQRVPTLDDYTATQENLSSVNKTQSPSALGPQDGPLTTLVKVPYTSVAEGWGDRLWTTTLFYSSPAKPYAARGVFPKPYFHASMIGYVGGMLATLAAMQISNHPQPALLYLVPGVLSSLWCTALIRGEFEQFWNFSDAIQDEVEEKQVKSVDAGKAAVEQLDNESGSKEHNSMSSFFSFKRNEERSQRLEESMTKHVDEIRSTIASPENTKRHTKARNKNDRKSTGSTILSFSIEAPPPLLRTGHGKLQQASSSIPEQPKSGGRLHGAALSEDEESDSDASAEVPRWSSGQGSDELEEHTGKRQRLD